MTTELSMLVYSVLLLAVLVMIQAQAGIRAQGVKVMAGPRDSLPEPSMFQARTKRVVDNHREGLTLFAPLVLAAAAAHVSNTWTVLGAELFFFARLAHAICYLTGFALRPLAWVVGFVGTLMVAAALLGLH
jgi:uncharacterized MAPEG superfamily protein